MWGYTPWASAREAPAFRRGSSHVLLYRWAYRRIPRTVVESARLDDARPFRLRAAVAFPLSRPTTATVGVLTFVLYWRDFITPLLYLRSESLYTLPCSN